ncbi:MAG TPA: DEAD/DEAH box helicase family protein [Chloroflexota bacterium]|nr:DEAD/DEAH box helicase family protein [Chloroflexota bacterium]
MTYNEADTRANLIDPKLNMAGWTRSQVTREHYYRPDFEYTAGRVVLRGDRAERQLPRRVDYLLRYTDSFPIAVVEAKAEGESALSGLQQTKDYARDLGVAFAYTTNGRHIIEWDVFTNTTHHLDHFPSPDELWERWRINMGLDEPPHRADFERRMGELRPIYHAKDAATRRRNPLLYAYAPPEVTRGKTPHYFQEAAIKEVLLRIMRGQRRILLTMATGTGKTFTAFQIVWKLIKSGWLQHKNDGRPGRVLFLADRVVLRNQAYNAFSPFAGGASDPRFLLDGKKKLSLNRDLYFAIYQNLWSEDNQGRRVFEQFPADFFDLIIIDEAHRSGWGSWKEILDHFTSAIHLGMTATPKQDENIDTYAYFCAEEAAIEAENEGSIRRPAYSYSLGQGIEDGFLATYKVHWIRTNVDREGLNIEEALERGAEVFVPEDVELRADYQTPQFERAITLPDRTELMTAHLAQLLRRFGPTQKTMVFCVDMEHAQEVARLLNNHFADLGYGDDYAVAIVSEEGETGRRRLQQFQDSDKKLPVVATTAELLSTGVDVPSVRNIVFMKTLNSPILFKQIVGRGTRIDEDTGKLWFRIIDYTGATRLIDEAWDKPPVAEDMVLNDGRLQTVVLTGTVLLANTEDVIQGANVALIAAPNDQRGPILSDDQGQFRFERLPAGELTLIASGPGVRQRQMQVVTVEGETTVVQVELKLATEQKRRKIEVTNLQVEIADEATFIVEGHHEPMTLQEYVNYTRQKVVDLTGSWEKLLTDWQEPETREALVAQLTGASVYPDVLTEVLDELEVDEVDILGHVAYDRALQTRYDRTLALRQRERPWLNSYDRDAREVIYALLGKYELGGLHQITDPRIFRVPPFRQMGDVRGVIRRFGGDAAQLRQTLTEIQRRLYAA